MSSTQLISIKTVLHEINMNPGQTFAVTLLTEDARVSHKAKVKKNPGKASGGSGRSQKSLQNIARKQRTEAELMLYDCIGGHPFRAKIRRLTHYNGQRIFHNY